MLVYTAWWCLHKPKHVAHCHTIETNKLIIHSQGEWVFDVVLRRKRIRSMMYAPDSDVKCICTYASTLSSFKDNVDWNIRFWNSKVVRVYKSFRLSFLRHWIIKWSCFVGHLMTPSVSSHRSRCTFIMDTNCWHLTQSTALHKVKRSLRQSSEIHFRVLQNLCLYCHG
jgi:hypothetical protein